MGTGLHGCPGLSALTNRPLRDRSPPLMARSPWHQAAILFLSFCAKSLQCALCNDGPEGSQIGSPVNRELTQRLCLGADNTLSVQKKKNSCICAASYDKKHNKIRWGHTAGCDFLWFFMLMSFEVSVCQMSRVVFVTINRCTKKRIKYGLWL